jgi:PKD repeat protein
VKKFYISLVSLVIAVSGFLLFNFMGANSNAASLPRDCDNNAIINCGATTASELATVYKKNATGDLDNIYHSYGLTDNDLAHAGSLAKMGAVHKDGRVTVGSTTVATGALTIGRQNMSGSHKKVIGGKTYYERAPSVSFASESIAAYVFTDANGNFKAAVLTACGNPVTAKPPVYKCDSLTQDKISRTEYSFNATASASNGASVSSYTYDFGDGQKSTTTAKTAKRTYTKPGTYTVKLSVTVKVNGTNKTVTAPGCETKVIVETPPLTPVYTCDSLTPNKISRTEYSFDGKATAKDGATIVNYSFDFGDGTAAQTVTNPAGVKHTYAKDGTYTTKMSVTVKVNGANKTVTGPQCQTQVTVETPPVTPVYSCDSLTASKISRTEYSFDGAASASNGATITNYVIDFGDTATQTVTNPKGVKHTYAKEGTYTVKLSVNVKVNGTDKTVTAPQCQTQIVVETPPVTPVYTCDGLTMTKIGRTDYSFNGSASATGGATITGYTFDFGDNTDVQTVANPIGVKHTYAKDGTYTAKLTATVSVNGESKTVTDAVKCVAQVTVTPLEECKPGIPMGDVRCTEECKPGIPVGDTRCTEECKPGVPVGDTRCNECKPGVPTGDTRCTPCEVPGKEQYPKDSTDCVETPVELPHTGPMDVIGGGLGLGSLIAAASYWYASRRGLLTELLNR